MEQRQLDVNYIEVEGARRPLSPETVAMLARSMGDPKIGLRTPITVRYRADRPARDGSGSDDSYVLVTGAHRLAAAKELGWEKIDCIVIECSDLEAEKLEIIENLHRADLSKEQRDRQIVRLAELIEEEANKLPQPAAVSQKGGRGKTGVAATVAKETGLSKDTVQRALNQARNPPPPKQTKPADDPLSEQEAAEKWMAEGMRWWNRGAQTWREEFLIRVDAPVMDAA